MKNEMVTVQIRLTGQNRHAIERIIGKLRDDEEAIEVGPIRASTRPKYAGHYICYVTIGFWSKPDHAD